MLTRLSGGAPRSTRTHRALAALLIAAGLAGCAQIVGIEPWEPMNCASGSDVSSESCEARKECSECVFALSQPCQTARAACMDDETCKQIFDCMQPCNANEDSITCVQSCCVESGGNALFDTFLTCVCDGCHAECGELSFECADYCNE